MANFPDTLAGFATAEARAYAKVKDKTWVNAHAARDKSGHVIIRFQRFMSSASAAAKQYGAWTETRDDATV
jgi:hypothetical protein